MEDIQTTAALDEEMARFEQALPGLLATIPGRWVVFRDGVVVGHFESADDAERFGYARFGSNGRFVLTQVEPQRTYVINPFASLFG